MLALHSSSGCKTLQVLQPRILRSLALPAGSAATLPIKWLERRLLRRSDAIVAISEDFRVILNAWRINPERISVIENWAPLNDLPEVGQANPWAIEHGLAGKRVVLYSGTLGLKHNPRLLSELARRVSVESDVIVVVVSEGSGAERLAQTKREDGLNNLVLLGFQPFSRLAEVHGSATVLVSILERDASVFSVPSKILSYLCAGRPILAAISSENLAARTLVGAGAGIVVDPDDLGGFFDAAAALLADPKARARCGAAARAYAVASFSLPAVADRFESVFAAALHDTTAAGKRRSHTQTVVALDLPPEE